MSVTEFAFALQWSVWWLPGENCEQKHFGKTVNFQLNALSAEGLKHRGKICHVPLSKWWRERTLAVAASERIAAVGNPLLASPVSLPHEGAEVHRHMFLFPCWCKGCFKS